MLDVTRRAFDVGDAVAGNGLSVPVTCDVGAPRSFVVVEKESSSVVAIVLAGKDAETALDTGVESPADSELGGVQRLPGCPLART